MKNKNYFVLGGILIILIILAVFLLFNPLENSNPNIPFNTNLNKAEAEQLALDTNQDWVVDLQPDYNVEVVETTFSQGIWNVDLKLWIEKTTAPLSDQKGFILEYKVNDSSGEVQKNPVRVDLS